MDQQHDPAPDAASTPLYCASRPAPGTLQTLADLMAHCSMCGHARVLHIGVDHCPVCELVDLNAQARAALTPATALSHAEKAFAEVDRRQRIGLPRAAYTIPEAPRA